jgi:hypothetical protein
VIAFPHCLCPSIWEKCCVIQVVDVKLMSEYECMMFKRRETQSLKQLKYIEPS